MVVSEFYFGLVNVEVEARIKKKGADLPSKLRTSRRWPLQDWGSWRFTPGCERPEQEG